MIETGLWFNGQHSKHFDLLVTRMDSGLIPLNTAHSRKINTHTLMNPDVKRLNKIENEVLNFKISLTPVKRIVDDNFKDQLLTWLMLDDYAPLIFDDNVNKTYNAIVTEQMIFNTNTAGVGYFDITFTSDSPWAYTPTTRYILNRDGAIQADPPVLSIFNTSLPVKKYYPIMLIKNKLAAKATIKVEDIKGNSHIMEFEDLQPGEELFIDNFKNIIFSTAEGSFPYHRFNKQWLSLNKGMNKITLLEGDAEVIFECRFILYSH